MQVNFPGSVLCRLLNSPRAFKTILAILFLGSVSMGYSQILSYTNSTTGALNTVAANATGTALARVNGTAIAGTPCSTGFSSTTFSTVTTYSSALSAVETSVTPASGYGLNVTGFQADLRRSASGPVSIRFAYSIDGGTTWVDQGSNQANPSASCAAGSTLSWTIPFTVNAPATLKFRIFGFGATSTAGTEQILNLLINGTVSSISSCTPPSLTASASGVTCNGLGNGAVNLATSGGSTPFSYLWSNGATTQNISGLPGGVYTLIVTANGGCSVTASATVNEPSVLSANINAQTNTGCTGNTGTATVSVSGGTMAYSYLWSNSQTVATATNLAANTYSVTVRDANACSTSTSVIILLAVPTLLPATNVGTTSVTLNWSAITGAVSYNVQYRKVGTTTWTTTTSNTNSLSIAGLSAGNLYQFQVQAVCPGNVTGNYSSPGNFSTSTGILNCNAPSTLSASNITATSAKLNWNVSLGAHSYSVQYRVVGTSTWTTATSTVNSLSVTGLTSGATYQFQVQTVCAAGQSSFSTLTTFTTGPVCPTPTNLTITNITSNTAMLNWGAVTGAASYNVRYRVVGTTTWTTSTSTTNTLAISGLIPATNYDFQVQTVCTGGVPGNFSTSGVFTTAPTGGGCAVPTGLTVSNITSTTALVNWNAVAGAVRYNVQYRVAGTSGWTTDTSGSLTYAISALTPSTHYEFQVQTLCSGGNTSAFSPSDTFSTTGACSSPPLGFSVSNITMVSATLNWLAIVGATGYNIQYRIAGTTTWTATTSTTNSKSITSLVAGTTYEFQVQVKCSGTSTSAYSASSTFVTSAALPRPDHVVIVIMENHSYGNIVGSSAAPNINALMSDTDATTFSSSYAIEHPSQPNYLDLFSGNHQGMTTDNVPTNYPFTTANLARELLDSNLTYTTYSEDLPSVGFDGATSGNYARKHNPAANWVGTGTNQILSTTNQPFTAFPTNYANLPTVSIVVPNLNNDMHNGTGNGPITLGDTWYQTNVRPYLLWAETHNSLLILTWDEDDLSSSNLILTVFGGQMVKRGTDTSTINHFSVLRTVEDMYKLGHAGSSAQAAPITNCWKQTQQSNASVCDFSLWSHVYNNYRLIIHDTCTYVTGTVDHLIYEADGDIHIRVNVDAAFSSLLNSGNVANQYGDLVVEPICATTVTQADAVSSCQGFVNTVYIPNVGEHVKVTGSYITDNDHGWNEIHPVTSIVITTQTASPLRGSEYTGVDDVTDDDYVSVKVGPNPTSDYINFSIGKRGNDVVYIEIMDELGRSAGQYQLETTSNLQITTSYLPSGAYFYNVIQNKRIMNTGRFVVVH